METYHALSRIAPPDPPADEVDAHALATGELKPDEPEPTKAADQPATIVNQTLEELAREGARRMLERALAAEVDDFLGRPRYERRMLAEHGYRNGYGRPRAVAVGTWPVEVRAPRVRDVPEDAEPFHSSILPRRRMLSTEKVHHAANLWKFYVDLNQVHSIGEASICWTGKSAVWFGEVWDIGDQMGGTPANKLSVMLINYANVEGGGFFWTNFNAANACNYGGAGVPYFCDLTGVKSLNVWTDR